MDKHLVRLLLVGILLLSIVLHPSARGQQYVFNAYQQADGLENLGVQDLAFDRQGFLWIATQNGVVRFLGAGFEHFGPEQGLKEREIRKIYVDPEGNIFAGTWCNVYRWNGTRFEPIAVAPVASDATSSLLTIAPGRLLVVQGGGVIEVPFDATGRKSPIEPFFSAEQRKVLSALTNVTTMTLIREGTLWLGCGTELCSLRNGRVDRWGPTSGVASAEWHSLHEDRRGSIWALSQKQLLELPPGGGRFIDRTPPTLPKGYFRWAALAEDREGRILVNAAKGISRWDGVRWQEIQAENGLTGKRVTAIAFDARGDPWVGSLTGLSHWTGYEHWEAWTDKQGLPSSTAWSISANNPAYALLGTVDGPARLNIAPVAAPRQQVESLVADKAGQKVWPYGQVSGIIEDKGGRVWMTTFSGYVLVLDPATLSVRQVAKLSAFIHRLIATANGQIWVLSEGGIDVIDHPENDSAALRHLREPDALLQDLSNTMTMVELGVRPGSGRLAKDAPDSADLLFLTESGPVRLHAGQWTIPNIDGLPTENMLRDEVDLAPDGSFWITGPDEREHSAVWHLQAMGANYKATRLDLPERFADRIIFSFLVDRRGWLWIGTDDGLLGWNGTTWREFNRESGLIWNDTNRGVMVEAVDGSIWIGTMEGAAHLLHPETAFDTIGLSVEILAMRRDDKSNRLSDGGDLLWANAPVVLDFAAPSSWNRSSLTFFYRLVGLDSSWIQTRSSQAQFSALPPGSYRFEVYASNPSTSSISPVATREFRLLPPWWGTRSMYCLYLIFAMVLFWLILRLWTRQLRLNQLKLEGLVSERTRALEQSREEMRVLATHDSLTGLLNRAAILESLEQEIERAHRSGAPLAVMIADIDHFKQVNDTYGHPAGDQVLRSFASGLSRNLRSYDHVGRYGGEEFLVVLGSAPQENFAERLAHFHSEVSNQTVHVESHQLTVNCSIGVSIVSGEDSDLDASESLSSADKALYEAKRAGRNRLVVDASGRAGPGAL